MIPELQDFALVWWTNLALRFWYRISIDIDLFSPHPFDSHMIRNIFEKRYDDLTAKLVDKNTLLCTINGIKVDILTHPYALIHPMETREWIRMYSVPDICAIKCSALLGRAVKKDYRDFAYLLKEYSLSEILWFFSTKYPKIDTGAVLRSLGYFDDVDNDKSELITLDDMTREQVKKDIIKHINKFFKNTA